MKGHFAAIILMIACVAFVKNKTTRNNDLFEKLYLLEGRWIMKTKKGAIGEEWVKIDKDYLQNRGYSIRSGDTIINERVALKKTPEGIFYISTVENQNNQPPTAFKLSSADNNFFVFENPQHDYPKRITYNFVTKDSIDASIDDGTPTPAKKSVFHYSRQK